MENSALDALLCPVCGRGFTEPHPGENVLRCASGHDYDIARQGYVNLLTGRGTKFAHDTADMAAARDSFLEAGHYQPLANALARVVGSVISSNKVSRSGAQPAPTGVLGHGERSSILDAGTGTGWYLQQILSTLSPQLSTGASSIAIDAIGLDISKFALRRALRRNPGVANLVWDLWQPLPLGANTVDVVLVIFAPRNAAEFARVLKVSGRLVVVTPGAAHLAEITEQAGMLRIASEKEAGLTQSMSSHFNLEGATVLRIALQLTPTDIRNVALMGPAGHHETAQNLAHSFAGLPDVTQATAEFTISVFQPLSAVSQLAV